jgi:hypothetical protein
MVGHVTLHESRLMYRVLKQIVTWESVAGLKLYRVMRKIFVTWQIVLQGVSYTGCWGRLL